MTRYYYGTGATDYLPYDRIHLISHYIMPNYCTLDWDRIPASRVQQNLQQLQDSSGAVYDDIQMYIHIPYCPYFCHYCSFTRRHLPRHDDSELKRYIELLIREINYYLKLPYVASRRFTSVCIGGGSPSSLPAAVLEPLFDYLATHLPGFRSIETTFTGEARSLRRPELLQLLKDYGWNRITWGIESLDDEIRREIGRHDTRADIEAVYAGLAKIGYVGETSLDMMFDLPGQSFVGFERELEDLVTNFKPDVLDAYSTIYLPYRPLTRMISSGKARQPPSIWNLLRMRERLYDVMLDHGYRNIVAETYSRTRTGPTHYLLGQCAREDIIPIGMAARGNFKDMVTVNPDTFEAWSDNIERNGVSTDNLQSIGLDGVLDRVMVMWPRLKVLSKAYLERFRGVRRYRTLMKALQRQVEIGVVDEREDRFEVNKLGVIWNGNLQTDYMRPSFNATGRLLVENLLCIRKRDFGKAERFVPGFLTDAIWQVRSVFPDFK
jgi:coproporphyrinogen III oxidase-like Fe-S oxidoreductase